MGGIVINKTIRTTKRNDLMAIIELEDLFGVISYSFSSSSSKNIIQLSKKIKLFI
ncbi:hypothetical protein Q5M85_07460 [Paraclostridium bifermentans]|nr:hypothetical protein [Paraclostridium bifermentans]